MKIYSYGLYANPTKVFAPLGQQSAYAKQTDGLASLIVLTIPLVIKFYPARLLFSKHSLIFSEHSCSRLVF